MIPSASWGGNAIPKHDSPEAKGSNPTTGITLLWARNPFRGILTTGNSHGQKPDRFSLNNNMIVEKVSRFKHATQNVRRLGEKKEELDKTKLLPQYTDERSTVKFRGIRSY